MIAGKKNPLELLLFFRARDKKQKNNLLCCFNQRREAYFILTLRIFIKRNMKFLKLFLKRIYLRYLFPFMLHHKAYYLLYLNEIKFQLNKKKLNRDKKGGLQF